ncbi:MAG: hypothetical protein EPN84_08710 [Legionella sp.]|nr:MAG: hypothetical protein EPN84_08710 [Legionella sp.]
MKKSLLFLLVLTSSIALAKSPLYPQESVMQFAGAQTLTYFQKGKKEKPLVIFIPGDSHLARIGYGYPQGNKKDFLAYWMHERGFSFLGLSYPLDNPVYNNKYPNFTISQWGEQIAETAEYFIKQHGLSKKIVVLGWSMGGSVEQRVYEAAKKRGLEMEAFIGLAAVPPLPFVMQSGPFDTNIITKDKLADRKKLYPWCIEQLELQNHLNNHTIIPAELYKAEFIGDIPAGISAEGYYLKDNQFIHSNEMTYEDSGVFNFGKTPWIALIVDDAKEDAKISLIDPYSWDYLRAEMIYKRYLKPGINPDRWKSIQDIVRKIPVQLLTKVHGTHFFFVGEQGAKATAAHIESLLKRVNYFKDLLKRQKAPVKDHALAKLESGVVESV